MLATGHSGARNGSVMACTGHTELTAQPESLRDSESSNGGGETDPREAPRRIRTGC